jgi:pentatricopeptide repeat protein
MNVHQFVSDETIVVDLDRNSIMFGQGTTELPAVPGKKWSKLTDALKGTAGHLFWRARGLETEYQQSMQKKVNSQNFKNIAKLKGEQRWKVKLQTLDHAFNLQYTPDSEHLTSETTNDNEQNQWDRVQESFLRFFVSILKDYRKFVQVPETAKSCSPTPESTDWLIWSKKHSFDRDGFISSQKPEYRPYLTELCATQQFDDFITKRLYSPELSDIIFFDQSIDAKLNRSRLKLKKLDTPFLQSAKTHKHLQTFLAVEPNATHLPNETRFIYKSWPEKFDPRLFCNPRPIPSMITAEFDRQASLVKQLRMNHSPGADEKEDLLDLYGSDYDSSPEGMAFTVFFYAYSSVIGREWQQYQQKRRELQMELLKPDSDRAGGDQERTPEQSKESVVVVEEEEDNYSQEVFSDLTLGVCDGNSCPEGTAAVNDAIVYVKSNSPCPNLNSQAVAAYESLTSLALSLDPSQIIPNTSLVDDDEAFAEYEEAREVATAQLDLAFDTLKFMEIRGMSTDPDVFQSLMEACGRCGNTKRALELIETMKRDGLVADTEVLVCFLASFAHYSEEGGESVQAEQCIAKRRGSDAYSNYLKKNFLSVKARSGRANSHHVGSLSDEDSSTSELLSDSGSDPSNSASGAKGTAPAFLQLFSASFPNESQAKKNKKRRRKRRQSSILGKDEISDRMKKQLVLGETLLEFLYPDVQIDAFGDACPQCSNIMKEEDIIAGWRPCEFKDFTTRCPQCHHRFVSRFKVSTSSPTFEGSQGPGTPLYCEFLSPWVLRKELGHIMTAGGSDISRILDPNWRCGRDIRATIWWNLVAMLKRHRLPFTFLLQGSFHNRLINPVPQD